MPSNPLLLASAAWQRAKRNDDTARAERWFSASVAYRIPDPEPLAKLLSVTTSAIDQMSGGYKVFWMLYQMDKAEAKRLRRKHSYSRFYEVGTLWAQYNFDVELLFEYLDADLSTPAIKEEITDHHDPRPKWERKAVSIAPTLRKFLEWGGVSPRLRELSAAWLEEVERLNA